MSSWIKGNIALTEPERRAIGALLSIGKEMWAEMNSPAITDTHVKYVGRILEEALALVDPNHGFAAAFAVYKDDAKCAAAEKAAAATTDAPPVATT